MKKYLYLLFLPLALSCSHDKDPIEPDLPTRIEVDYVNYFREGTKWYVNQWKDQESLNNMTPSVCEFWLEGEELIDGVAASKLMSYNSKYDPEPLVNGYVCVDNGKVMFHNLKSNSSWNILYDFDMRPGDWTKVEVTHLGWRDIDYYTQKTGVDNSVIDLYCRELYESDFHKGIYEMKMGYEEDPYQAYHDGTWYMGIGAKEGPLDNGFFYIPLYYSRLYEVTYNGEVVFHNPDAASIR